MIPVTLSRPAEFPAQFEEPLTLFLRAVWEGRRWEMEQQFGLYDLPLLTDDQLRRSLMADKLEMIAKAAAGEYDRSDDVASEVSDCCQSIAEFLFAPPGVAYSYTIPADFWTSPFGQIMALAFIWLEGDALITIGEAARLSGKSISTISSRVQRGTLRSYPDPKATNPQKAARLVRRSDIEEIEEAPDAKSQS